MQYINVLSNVHIYSVHVFCVGKINISDFINVHKVVKI